MSSLVKGMGWRLFGAKALSEPIPNYWQWDTMKKFRDNWFKIKKVLELTRPKRFSKQNGILHLQATREILSFRVICRKLCSLFTWRISVF